MNRLHMGLLKKQKQKKNLMNSEQHIFKTCCNGVFNITDSYYLILLLFAFREYAADGWGKEGIVENSNAEILLQARRCICGKGGKVDILHAKLHPNTLSVMKLINVIVLIFVFYIFILICCMCIWITIHSYYLTTYVHNL